MALSECKRWRRLNSNRSRRGLIRAPAWSRLRWSKTETDTRAIKKIVCVPLFHSKSSRSTSRRQENRRSHLSKRPHNHNYPPPTQSSIHNATSHTCTPQTHTHTYYIYNIYIYV